MIAESAVLGQFQGIGCAFSKVLQSTKTPDTLHAFAGSAEHFGV